MSVTGPARANLTAQLQEKLAQDRQQIEVLTTRELQQLAESLRISSRAALDAMESDTRERLARMQREMDEIATRQRRWPLWTALSSAVIALAVFALLWMATNWARSDLRTALTERYEARLLLDDLYDQTRGVTLQVSETGQEYVVGPEGSRGTYCNEIPCIALPED